MKVLKIDQNTDEWLEFRKGKSGGSAFGKLFRVNGRGNGEMRDHLFMMLAERVAKPMSPNDYMGRVPAGTPFSWAVRGHVLEEDAARKFSEVYGKDLSDGYVWVSDDDDASYVSPDRVAMSDDGVIREAVEIKCLSSDRVLKVWYEKCVEEKPDFDIIPTNEYKAQALKYFIVNEDLEKLYWVVYTDLIPSVEMVTLEITRSDVADLVDEAKAIEKGYLDELENLENILTKSLWKDNIEI